MRLTAFSIVGTLVLAAPVWAQDDPMAHFDAYQSAMAEGRVDEAATAGLAAWRAAEATWGDSRETAVLAYNIASLDVRLGRSEAAIEPATRALALAEAGVAQGDVPAADAALVLGLAEFAQSGGAQGVDRLLEALDDRGDEPAEVDDLVAYGWLSVAMDAQAKQRWNDAAESAREARVVATRMGSDYASLAVDAASVEAVSAVAGSEWADARAAYREALRSYPASANPATDQRLATLMAWEFASAMVLRTQFELQRQTGTNLRPVDENARFEAEGPVRRQQSCYDWIEPRREPVFPTDVAWTGDYGAILVAYDVTTSGALENVRIAATAPAEMAEPFTREVLEDVPSWRATVHPDAADACLKNQTAAFGFYFE